MKSLNVRLPLVALMLVASGSWALGPGKPQPVGRQNLALTAQEKSLTQATVLSDARVQQIVGAGQARVEVGDARPDKYEEIAFLRGETQKPPSHQVWTIVFNPTTNKAAEVLTSLEQGTILKVQEIKPTDVSLTRVDVEEGLALAKASLDLRRAIGAKLDQFVIADSAAATATVPFSARPLRVRSSDPNDPCTLDRCLDLVFRTDAGYLPLRAEIDLTQHTVSVRGGQGKGKHR
jgi:hypothetical protein